MSGALEAPRGLVRAALSSALPHAGVESDDTPNLGRVRLVATGDALLVWTTDHLTSVVARVEHPEYTLDELPSWDMPADAVKKVLAVFRGPSNTDARQMWNDEPMRIEVGEKLVRFTEVGSFVDGQSLSVARIIPAGEDTYPDVPRELTALADAIQADPAEIATVNMAAIARFLSAAKAYSREIPIASFLAGVGVHRVLVRVGSSVLGSAPAYPQGPKDATAHDVRLGMRAQHDRWDAMLRPLRRVEPVRVTQDDADELARQAAEVYRLHGATTSLRVVPDLPAPVEDPS